MLLLFYEQALHRPLPQFQDRMGTMLHLSKRIDLSAKNLLSLLEAHIISWAIQ
jgi:hypothetical protein